MMPEFFPLVDIADMYFNYRKFDCHQGIPENNTVMGQSGRVDDYPFIFIIPFMNEINDFTLMVALKDSQVQIQFPAIFFYLFIKLSQSEISINLRFPHAQHIQIWSMYNSN